MLTHSNRQIFGSTVSLPGVQEQIKSKLFLYKLRISLKLMQMPELFLVPFLLELIINRNLQIKWMSPLFSQILPPCYLHGSLLLHLLQQLGICLLYLLIFLSLHRRMSYESSHLWISGSNICFKSYFNLSIGLSQHRPTVFSHKSFLMLPCSCIYYSKIWAVTPVVICSAQIPG